MARRPRRIGFDPRLVIGVTLILGSIVGVWGVVQAADTSSPVLVASSTLSVGDTVTSSDLTVAHLRLDASGEHYLTAVPAAGLTVTRTIFAGELVPRSAVRTDAEVEVSAIVVPSALALAASVETGSLVDVWAAEQQDDGSFAPPTVIVSDVSVVRVVEEQGLVAAGSGERVEVLVPTGRVAALLAALSDDSAISIVPAG
ncbi:MAG: SAF domain-containing protein [Mycetocola sp.]